MEAERETIDLKKAEFMSDKVGETFEGIISGVGQFGFFVQLPNTVEGLVHVSNLHDDYYYFHDKFYALIGERTRRRFRLGDPVVVRLTRVDVDNRQLDFVVQLDDSPAVTVATVPTETRSRAAKKRVLSGPPAEELGGPVPAGEKTGRNRKRRGNKGRRGQGGAGQPEAGLLEPIEPTAIEPDNVPPVREAERPVEIKPLNEAPRPARDARPPRERRPERETRQAGAPQAGREANPGQEPKLRREAKPGREPRAHREAKPAAAGQPVRVAVAPREAAPAVRPDIRPARPQRQERPAAGRFSRGDDRAPGLRMAWKRAPAA